MNFKKWLEDYEEAFAQSVLKSAEKQRLKMDGHTVFIPGGLDEKSLKLYTAYRHQKTTNLLVWATWALAIGTLVLSGLTIYFQYFKK